METTLVFLKPDAVQRGLTGVILSRFEAKGLRIAAMKMMNVPLDLARRHYAEHEGKPFYDGLIRFVTSAPVVVLAIRGAGAIVVCRKLIGATDAAQAQPGTIRGDLGLSSGYNLIHGSDSADSAQRELAMWFDEAELTDYQRDIERWVYEPSE